jgi:hypothetical protein
MEPHAEPRKHSLKRSAARVAAALGLFGVVCAVLAILFGNLMLNSYARTKIEKAFTAAHPGQVLRIGPMDNSWSEGRLATASLLLTTPDFALKTGPIAIHHVRWAPLLARKPALPEVFAQASLEATNVTFEFSSPRYELRCARLEASVPAAALSAEAISLSPQVADEAFFAARPFCKTRLRVVIPDCRVVGLSYPELLAGTAYRAQSLQVSGLQLDALVNRDKPNDPVPRPGLMVHEALAKLGKVIALDVLTLTNGTLIYCERPVANAPPGVLTFGAVQISAKGLISQAPPGTAMSVQAQGNLMNAGTLKVAMSLPVVSPDFSLSYSGSLSTMDITRLNAYLKIAEHFRITSCRAESVTFDIQVKAGHATGNVYPIYRDLNIALLNQETGSAKGVMNRTESFLANLFKIRNASLPDSSGKVRAGKVNYERKPDDTFLQFIWFALRSGVLDSIRS